MRDPFAYLRQDVLDEDDRFRIYESEHDSNPAVVRFIANEPDVVPGWYWAWAEDMPGEEQAIDLERLIESVGPFHAQTVLDRTEEKLTELARRGDPHGALRTLRAELDGGRVRYREMIREISQAHMDAARRLVELEMARSEAEQERDDLGGGGLAL